MWSSKFSVNHHWEMKEPERFKKVEQLKREWEQKWCEPQQWVSVNEVSTATYNMAQYERMQRNMNQNMMRSADLYARYNSIIVDDCWRDFNGLSLHSGRPKNKNEGPMRVIRE